MKQYVIRISAIILLFSCEKKIDFDLPDHEPQLVVYGFLNAGDTSIQVQITSSMSVTDTRPYHGRESDSTISDFEHEGFTGVKDANIEVFRDGEFISNLQYEETFLSNYAGNIDIIAGSYYTLQISAPGYPSVTATTYIPEYLEELEKVEVFPHEKLGRDSIKLFIKDYNIETEDYYSFNILKNDTSDNQDNSFIDNLNIFSEADLSDNNTKTIFIYNWNDSTYQDFQFIKLSTELYKLIISLKSQVTILDYPTVYSTNNPPSNVTGGYGIVAGYHAVTFRHYPDGTVGRLTDPNN